MFTRKRTIGPALFAAVTLLALGCQGTSSTPIATPTTGPSGSATEEPSIPAAVLDADALQGQGLIGANYITINTETMTATVEPVRTASAVGDAFNVDVFEFFKRNPCGDCLQVRGLGYTGSDVEVEFVARHPFDFTPVRHDLHGYDLRGTAIPLGQTAKSAGATFRSELGGVDTPVAGAFGSVTNADGWSSFFKEAVEPVLGAINPQPTGNIFPYKLFFQDLAPSNYDGASGTFSDLQNPTGHNTIAMGEGFPATGTKFHFGIDPAVTEVRFLFLLDAAWGQSTTRADRLNPKIFLPEFHRKDPFQVDLQIGGAPLVANRSVDIAQAQITVLDWQGETPGNPTFGPTAPPSSLRNKSGVAGMDFFVNGLMSGPPIHLTRGVDFNGVVNPGEYWTTYSAVLPFTNSIAAPAGRYYATLAVRDDMYGSANLDLVDAVVVREGIINPPLGLTDISTYAVAIVDVSPIVVDCPGIKGPTADNPIVVPPADGTFNQGKSWNFLLNNIVRGDVTALDEVQVDLDWDGNPSNFGADGGAFPIVGVEPASVSIPVDFSGLIPQVSAPEVNHQVGFRISDTDGNCNYRSALITLWPSVTCPGARGPAFTLGSDSPKPQGTNMNFTINALIPGGQTAIASITVTATGFPSYTKNVPAPPGPYPTIVNFTENFPSGTFGVILVDTAITMNVLITDVEGNCNTQSITVTVQNGVLPPDFILVPNPTPATVRHGQDVQIDIDNITTPGSSFTPTAGVGVQVDPNWDGVLANFVHDPLVTLVPIDANTWRATYNYRSITYLPPNPPGPYNFGVRIVNALALSTTKSEPVTLTPNAAPTIVLSASPPPITGFTTAPSITLNTSHFTASDTQGGSITSYRISWGDTTSSTWTSPFNPISKTYSAAGNYTINVFVRDDGYGPTNGPAPLPTNRESALPASWNILISVPSTCPGIWCEDFETTTPLGIPAGWVRPTSPATTSRFGVKSAAALTSGTPIASPVQTRVLEESGTVGATSVDTPYAANGGTGFRARWGVFSPPIVIPGDLQNYRVEIVHRASYSWWIGPPNATADGARLFVKAAPGATVPDAVTETSAPGTLAVLPALTNGPLTPISAPFSFSLGGLCFVNVNALGNPMAASPPMPNLTTFYSDDDVGSPAPWVTSTFDLNSFRGQTIRLYFAHGQTLWDYGGALCLVGTVWNPDASQFGYNTYGWRIDRARVYIQ